MTTLSDAKTAARRMWALGDYHRFATQLVWSVGPVLVEAGGIRPGMRVLDVAAGTGNVALRAAEAGADVVASDLTPESLEAGRRAAGGLAVEWVEADAEALPFADDEFDVVTSAFGAIFAPDQTAVARELQRVCRPGGTIVMANFTPEGLAGEFFATLARHAPASAGPSPLTWGEEAHVRELLAGADVAVERRTYTETVPGGPEAYAAFFAETFGPVIALHSDALDRDLLAFAERANEAPPGAPFACTYEYLLVVARLMAP